MKIIAHRGYSSKYPENTLLAFEQAFIAGADMVELDVRRCKSGELVVIHDDNIARTTSGSGRVAELTLQELRAFDAGNGQRIPTLQEVVDIADNREILIEIKNVADAQYVAKFISERIKSQRASYSSLTAISFDIQALEEVKSVDGNIQIGYSFKEPNDLDKAFSKLDLYSINPSIKCAKPQIITLAHSHNIQVFCWTAKTQEQLKAAYSLGIDGIMLDDIALTKTH